MSPRDSAHGERVRPLQKLWRSLTMRALLQMLPAGPGERMLTDLLQSGRKLRVLYIRHDMKIGDLVMATGIVRSIAESSPNIALDVLTSTQAGPVLLGNPHINKLLLYNRRDWRSHPSLWREIRRGRYDIVVDGRVNHISRHGTLPLFLVASGCRVRVGAESEHARLYSRTVKVTPGLHFVEQAASVVVAFGIPVDSTDFHPEIFLTEGEKKSALKHWNSELSRTGGKLRLLVNISAAGAERHWPEERFVEVLKHAGQHPSEPAMIVISGARDSEAAVRIAEEVGATAVRTPGLREAIALVATCDVLFTPDTGIAHIASAFRKPTVDLLLDRPIAPGPPMRRDAFVPYRTPGRNLFSPDMKLTSLKTEPVIDALDEVLTEYMRHHAPDAVDRN